MKTFFATLACAAAASSFMAEDDTLRFWKWAIAHGRNYQSEEELEHRFLNFIRNEAEVEVLNSLGHDATYGLNDFSDYTKEEFNKLISAVPMDQDEFDATVVEEDDYFFETSSEPNGMTVDWKAKGAVTGVKNQGGCGSCWAFSSTGAMEGAHYIATGKLLSLSEQQIVDCCTAGGCYGCNGGRAGSAFGYAKDSPMQTESSYPYAGKDGKCKYDSSKGKVRVKSNAGVKRDSPSALKSAITQGPVSVFVDGSGAFGKYSSGILCSGCGTDINHVVLAVGYGTSNGKEFYLVKNSWGTSWGDKGYVKIGVESGDGCCGIQMQSVSVTTY